MASSYTGTATARKRLAKMADMANGGSVKPVKRARKRVAAASKGNYGGASPSSASPGRSGVGAPTSKSPGTGNSFKGGYQPSSAAKTGQASRTKTPFRAGFAPSGAAKTGQAARSRGQHNAIFAVSRAAKKGVAKKVSPRTAFAKSRAAR